ncbi:hypothetical protein PIB30_079598 [Stylosanthes scabra]|uniref:Uncharacterized protein n=1 Tax=Stylosanthes scabra TaxID=79078 RepID=A0ABU6ZPS6_9FABA|nr:hypothetical protein [Stylosanthes scabra]
MNALNRKKTTLLQHLTISMRTNNHHPITDSIILNLKGGVTANKIDGIYLNNHNKPNSANHTHIANHKTHKTQDINHLMLDKLIHRQMLLHSTMKKPFELMEEEEEEEIVEKQDKGETFFIATAFGGRKKVEHEIPIKCEDPGPCLVTCKIRGIDVRECLCDPGACGSVMPFELYETLNLGLLKKSKEVFTMVDASIASVA